MFKEFKKELQLDLTENKNNLANLLNICNSIGNYSDFFKDEIEKNKKYIQATLVNEFNKLDFNTLYMAFSKPCIGALTKGQRGSIALLLLKNLSADLKNIDIKNEKQYVLLAKNLFALMEVTFNAAILNIKLNISDISEIIQNTIIPNLSKIKNGEVLANLYMLVPYDKDVFEKLESGIKESLKQEGMDEQKIQKQILKLQKAKERYRRAFMLD
ncbi:hypothetical protein HZA39_04265 [Candidatus Peregrinibacteria bacterium]|nr:hypothetical protein [Candidatus Peregrinibacteria bacterium]